MAITSKLIPISILIASLAVGIISFYIMSDLSKEQKKQRTDELISQLINFVIFIWLAKIILNISIFIEGPVAILAYPSGSDAFYLAVLFTALLLVYKAKRKQMEVFAFIESFLHVFLVGSFVYEFIQLIWFNNANAFGYLLLLAILLIMFFSLRSHLKRSLVILVILFGWSAGILVLSFILPFVTVFGYIMEPWFIGLFFVINLFIIILKRRRFNR